MFIVAGAPALSVFKQDQLLARLSAVAPVTAVDSQFIYLFDQALSESAQVVAQGLLNDGQSYALLAASEGSVQLSVQLIVTPRIGTISPWSSKASDIFTNCGQPVSRLERATVYTLHGITELTPAVVALLHDRMTESTFNSVDAAQVLFS